MPEIRIVPAHFGHAVVLSATMRQADRDEIYAAHLQMPFSALKTALDLSTETQTALVDDEVACMFGVSPGLEAGSGVPWLLGSELIVEHAIPFQLRSARYLEDIRKRYTMLENYVDARNTVSVRWLQDAGFTLEEAKPHGALGMDFHHFHWEAI